MSVLMSVLFSSLFYLLFICCRNMTEVFTGLPEQDVLLTEFFLEKFL